MTATDSMRARVDRVRETLGVDVCTLYLARAEDQRLEIIASSGLDQAVIGRKLLYTQGLTGKVARTGKPVVARDIRTHRDNFHVEGSGEEQFTSYLGIPLEQDDALYGVLVIQTRASKTFFHRDISELHNAGRDLLAVLPMACTEM